MADGKKGAATLERADFLELQLREAALKLANANAELALAKAQAEVQAAQVERHALLVRLDSEYANEGEVIAVDLAVEKNGAIIRSAKPAA